MITRIRDQKGLTMVELLVVIVMASMIAVLLGGIIFIFYGSILRTEIEARVAVDSQIILRNMVEELRSSSGVRSTNTIPDPFNVAGWNTSSDDAILIIETPVISSTDEFITNPLTGELYKNEIVYFAEGNSMRRRVLVDPAATENDRVQTCPIEDIGTNGCEGADALLSNDYRNMIFEFFDQDDISTTVLENAESIDMTIDLGRTVYGSDVELQNNIRVTLRN